LERHHPAGRIGQRILIYVYITPAKHRWIHDNSKAARELGWIRNEAQGFAHDPDQPRPWLAGTCINENLLK